MCYQVHLSNLLMNMWKYYRPNDFETSLWFPMLLSLNVPPFGDCTLGGSGGGGD